MNASRSPRHAPAPLPGKGPSDELEPAVARPIPPLNSTARRALRADAHHLDPVVMIGDSGLTPAVIAETDRALTAHQLIKIRVLGDDREVRRPMMESLCSALGCAPVQIIGKLLVVWRPLADTSKNGRFVPKKEAAQRAEARTETDGKPARPTVTRRKPASSSAKPAGRARSGSSGGAARAGGTARSGDGAPRAGGATRSGSGPRPGGARTGGTFGSGGFSRSGTSSGGSRTSGTRSGSRSDSGGFSRSGGSGWSGGADRPTGGRPAGGGQSRGGFSSPDGGRPSGPRGPRSGGGDGVRSTGSRPTGDGGFGQRRGGPGSREGFRSEGDRPAGSRPPRGDSARPARSTGSGFGRPQGARSDSSDRGPRQSGTGFPSRPGGSRSGAARSDGDRARPSRSGPSRASGPARNAAAKGPGRRPPTRKR